MCGITGIIHNTNKNYESNIQFMNKSLIHRGPDSFGTKKFKNAILGHSRLSIIDISNGHQPMSDKNDNQCITFNGEIYGYLDIKKDINYKFTTNSDTEVILALYKDQGLKMFEKLKGMFAFAIWDEKKQALLLARDRFGEKPLYYAFGENGEFIFGSEIKAILASNLVKPKISKTALVNYFKTLYINPVETIYENIYTLAPASHLLYKDGKIEIRKYFSYPSTRNIPLGEACEKFKKKFESSVRNQLIADVDVGAFLSGGLDSSTIVSVAQNFKKDLKTFSFGFEGSKSELPYAREIAKKYGTDHYELFAEDVDISEMLITMSNVYDEPFADSSNIPTYLISKLAREHSKVVLTGDGADELLGGYDWWYNPLLGIGEDKNFIKEMIFRIIAKALVRNYSAKANRMKFARKYSSILDAHSDKPCFFNKQEIKSLIGECQNTQDSYSFDQENTINDALKVDLKDYMAGDILVKTDRASMANSLELRSPFLDTDFASFCISLPFNLKISEQRDKLILREAYQAAWTKSIMSRKKQGFGGPVNKWLRQNNVKDLKNEYFKKNRSIFSFVSYVAAKNYFNKDNYQTWALLVLSIWFEKNIKNL